MWCKYHPNNWNGLLSVPASELWSIGQQHQFVERILSGELKEPKDKKGIVDSPLIDFIHLVTTFSLSCTSKSEL
jgi:hypothetical protein